MQLGYGGRFGRTRISNKQFQEAQGPRGELSVRGVGRTSHRVRAVTA